VCHKEAANAICEWFRALYPDSETMCRNVMDYVPRVMRGAIVSAYNGMTRKSPWLWERLYRDTDVSSSKHPLSAFWNALHRGVGGINVKRMLSDLDEFGPHMVFATHFFGMTSFLDKWEHRTPIYFVCTDYLSHVTQRDPRYDGWFVGSDEAIRQYTADSVPTAEYAVRNFGIPISRNYLVPPTRDEGRRALAIDDHAKVVSVVDGGTGARILDVVASSLVDLADWRVFIICREDKKLHEYLRDKYFPFKHITVLSDATDVADYYAASDVVILDPNGVQIAEASAVGAAILLMEPLPGLGRHNCDYLLERGAARKIYEHRKTGELLNDLIASRESLERMKYRARAMSRPSAGMDIVTWVMEKADAIDNAAQDGAVDEMAGEPELSSLPDEEGEDSALDDAKAV
jgi:processive 1,2-diacylglycerol beta-glucosyltransferase